MQHAPRVHPSPGVGVRRVARLRRIALVVLSTYGVAAAIGFAVGGLVVLAAFVGLFAYTGIPLLAHWRRISEPATQTRAGALREGTLTVGVDGITVEAHDGLLAMRRADVVDGWLEPSPGGGQRVVIRHRDGDLGIVEVPSVAAGRSLLEEVGLSADQHLLRVQTTGNAHQTLREAGFMASALFLAFPLMVLGILERVARPLGEGAIQGDRATALALLVLAAMATAALGAAAVKPVVWVGLDGVAITRGRSRRFVAVRDVTAVVMTPSGVELSLRGSKAPLVLRCWGVQQAALFARIQEIVGGLGTVTTSEDQLARLDRAGRDLGRWREALRREAGHAGGYRRVGLAPEELVRVLVQGDAPPERRIGAALALASSGDPAARQRVRVAAQASASDELRAVLEAIAEDEMDEVEARMQPFLGTAPPRA